jgi:hypothetical protein
MPLTYEEAYDLITNRVIAEWPTRSAAAVGSAVEMRYKGIEKEIPSTMFARFTMRPVLEGQASFRGGEDNPQRYKAEGLIFIQIFVPKKIGQVGEEYSRKLGEAAKRIFRGKTFDGCVTFKNVRVVDLDPEEMYLRKNMIADYEYDDIG